MGASSVSYKHNFLVFFFFLVLIAKRLHSDRIVSVTQVFGIAKYG